MSVKYLNLSINQIFQMLNSNLRCSVRLYLKLFVGFIYLICVCLHIVMSNTYYVVFCFVFLNLVCPMLPVSQNCPFLITPSVFCIVYLQYIFYNAVIIAKSFHVANGLWPLWILFYGFINPVINDFVSFPFSTIIISIINKQTWYDTDFS